LFGGTAKEFIHLFAAHEDTIHHHYEGEGLVIENEHHHCTFLSFSLQPFDTYQVVLIPQLRDEHFTSYHFSVVADLSEHSSLIPSLRGPPIV
jgi:hypothetical protein